MSDCFWVPDWPLPGRVRCLITTRRAGVSKGCFSGNNLAGHVADDPCAVRANRDALRRYLGAEPQWINQTHSTHVWHSDRAPQPSEADGCYTAQPGRICAVLTADCLPILFTTRRGDEVAAVHAGWRGLAAGILPSAIACFRAPATELQVYLGPAISQAYFEVGADVLTAFEAAAASRAFLEPVAASFCAGASPGKYQADLFRLARSELLALGVHSVAGGQHCTYAQPSDFFSFRRDGQTGRFASLIWIEPLACTLPHS